MSTNGMMKIQLTMKINFISSKDSNETRTMHTTSDNIEIMVDNETDEIVEELFESLLQKDQEALEKSMKGCEFAFDSIDLLYYRLHKISLNRSRSYIDSPEWLKNKEATINPKNSDNKCFPYAVAVALNHEQIKKNPERISNIKSFIDQYNWRKTYFLSHKSNWNEFEKNNKAIALNVSFVPYNTEQIKFAYVSQYNSNRENQVIILMITDKWHYLIVKCLPALLSRITSTNNGDFYCLNYFHSFVTKIVLKKHENVCKDHDYCCVEMPNKDNNI